MKSSGKCNWCEAPDVEVHPIQVRTSGGWEELLICDDCDTEDAA